MKITDADVRYISDLANLRLTDRERAEMQKDLNTILEYIDQLSQVETSDLDPMAQVAQISASNRPSETLRPDERRDCLPHDLAMANAPQSDGTFFRVPKVIER
jgi:aspartyl-tRNA(Asn)/glutamyl-tRNA(Gln) amidotransferase subunit C